MIKTIGIRELKNQTSGIVRQVREGSAEYIITHHGLPVAILRPIEKADLDKIKHEQALEAWHTLLKLGDQLAQTQVTKESAVELLEAMRERLA